MVKGPPVLAACFAIALQAQNGYLTYTAGVNPTSIVAGDLNGDRKPDVAIADTGSASLTILLNNGAGGFTAAPPVAFSGSFAPMIIAAADLNRDGKTDLVVVGTAGDQSPAAAGGIAILLGNGDGTFQTPQLVANSSSTIFVQVADLNGDGIPDVAATFLTLGFLVPTGAGVTIYTGDGDGTFTAGFAQFLNLTPWAVLAIGDYNKDGKPDVAAVTGHDLTVLLNDGTANFTRTDNNSEPWNFAPAIAVGDLNGDGVLDLAVTSQSNANPANGSVSILLGAGDGTFKAASSFTTAITAQNAAIADLNGDGYADLLVGSNPPVFFPGSSGGSLAGGLPFAASGNTGYFALADFTGTGVMGLAAADYRLNSSALEVNGSVVILPEAIWPAPTLANVSAAGFGLGPLAQGSVVSALGSNLSSQTGTASTGTPPVSLVNTTVTVTGTDGNALPAELYYVSPQQVNYVIPENVPAGLATVTIRSNGSVTAMGKIEVTPVAPALFTVNSANLAAAYITRVSANGQQTYEPVYTADSSGNYSPMPIDLSSATDTIYLSIFGTGIRNAPAPAAAVATFDATFNAQVTYAGAQGSYDGLDQVNILLPSGPDGPLTNPPSTSIVLQLSVAGQPSNRVTLSVQ